MCSWLPRLENCYLYQAHHFVFDGVTRCHFNKVASDAKVPLLSLTFVINIYLQVTDVHTKQFLFTLLHIAARCNRCLTLFRIQLHCIYKTNDVVGFCIN